MIRYLLSWLRPEIVFAGSLMVWGVLPDGCASAAWAMPASLIPAALGRHVFVALFMPGGIRAKISTAMKFCSFSPWFPAAEGIGGTLLLLAALSQPLDALGVLACLVAAGSLSGTVFLWRLSLFVLSGDMGDGEAACRPH